MEYWNAYRPKWNGLFVGVRMLLITIFNFNFIHYFHIWSRIILLKAFYELDWSGMHRSAGFRLIFRAIFENEKSKSKNNIINLAPVFWVLNSWQWRSWHATESEIIDQIASIKLRTAQLQFLCNASVFLRICIFQLILL